MWKTCVIWDCNIRMKWHGGHGVDSSDSGYREVANAIIKTSGSKKFCEFFG